MRADLVEVGPGVDERAERHVAGDAGEAVEPGDGSPARPAVDWPGAAADGEPTCRNSRTTAQAAPNPLSMPTTVMPAAHDGEHGRAAR